MRFIHKAFKTMEEAENFRDTKFKTLTKLPIVGVLGTFLDMSSLDEKEKEVLKIESCIYPSPMGVYTSLKHENFVKSWNRQNLDEIWKADKGEALELVGDSLDEMCNSAENDLEFVSVLDRNKCKYSYLRES